MAAGWWPGLSSVVPALGWLRSYDRTWLRVTSSPAWRRLDANQEFLALAALNFAPARRDRTSPSSELGGINRFTSVADAVATFQKQITT